MRLVVLEPLFPALPRDPARRDAFVVAQRLRLWCDAEDGHGWTGRVVSDLRGPSLTWPSAEWREVNEHEASGATREAP